MQITLDIPDVIPQEVINKLLTQWRNQVQIEENLATKSNSVITTPESEQLKIGREFMQEYQETFNALAK